MSESFTNPDAAQTDFLAFNEQLAHLADAGLPLEQGLRLIATDLRHGRLARTISSVADELEKGVPLSQAIERHRGGFPSLYSKLVDAGTRGRNLAALLYSLGTHLETQRKLREALWRAVAYPIVLLVGLLVVLTFVSFYVLPGFAQMQSGWFKTGRQNIGDWQWYYGYKQPPLPTAPTGMPIFTQVVMTAGRMVPLVALGVVTLLVVAMLVRLVMRITGAQGLWFSSMLMRVPLIGPVLRHALIARWLNVVKLAVQSGMPLNSSLELAGETIALPRLHQESCAMAATISSGSSIQTTPTRLVPQAAKLAIDVATHPGGNLPATLATLAEMHHRQAELRIARIPLVLTPMLLLLVAVSIAAILLAVFVPIVDEINRLLNSMSSGGWKI